MNNTLYNIGLLKERTAAAALLPEPDLPLVGTVVYVSGRPKVVYRHAYNMCYHINPQGHGNFTSRIGLWRYATPAEIDQFAADSELPEIVDPLEAMVDEVLAVHNSLTWLSRRQIARAAILAERARAAEVG